MKLVSAGLTDRLVRLRGCADRRQTGDDWCRGAAGGRTRRSGAAAQQVVMPAALDDLAALDHQ